MSKTNEVLAIICGDLHFSHDPPKARAETREEWYAIQQYYCRQIGKLAIKFNADVVITGDIFDKWDNPSELVNQANSWLKNITPINKKVYAIPGQHDLPNHNFDEIHRSSYCTLTETEAINHLASMPTFTDKGLALYGFPWGSNLTKLDRQKDNTFIHFAVIHHYAWIAGHVHPGAKREDSFLNIKDQLKGFDVIAAGDNHSGFLSYEEDFFVNGTFMRRKSDEINYKPMVGILYSDGKIKPHYLDTSQDKFRSDVHATDKQALENSGLDYEDFIQSLQSMTDSHLNFKKAAMQAIDKMEVSEGVRNRMILALEHKK